MYIYIYIYIYICKSQCVDAVEVGLNVRLAREPEDRDMPVIASLWNAE